LRPTPRKGGGTHEQRPLKKWKRREGTILNFCLTLGFFAKRIMSCVRCRSILYHFAPHEKFMYISRVLHPPLKNTKKHRPKGCQTTHVCWAYFKVTNAMLHHVVCSQPQLFPLQHRLCARAWPVLSLRPRYASSRIAKIRIVNSISWYSRYYC
jgi:hypothetical protein